MSIPRVVGVVAAVAAISSMGMACGASDDEAGTAVESGSAKPFEWGVITPDPPRALVVGGGIDYCVGEPRPRIARPRVEYRGDDVYVRLNVKRPPKKVSKGEACFVKELLITRAITLRRDLSEVEVYNADVEPPKLVWPRER